jgi:hypothetical protein
MPTPRRNRPSESASRGVPAPRRPRPRIRALLRRSRRKTPTLFGLTLDGLAARWARPMADAPIGAEAMRGADKRAQAMGVPGTRLMENAGCAVAAAVKALAIKTDRWGKGPDPDPVRPRQQRRRRLRGGAVSVAPGRAGGGRSGWDRRAAGRQGLAAQLGPPRGETNVERIHTPVARDVIILGQGVEKAAVVVDALLGTGVEGPLRDPIRSAVDLIGRARRPACRSWRWIRRRRWT